MHKARLAAAAAAVGILLWAQLAPRPGDPAGLPDGPLHFLLYAGFVLGTWLFGPRTWGGPQRRLRTVTSLGLVLGIVLEVLQEPLPTRDFEAGDLAMNLLGCLAGFGTAVLAMPWVGQRGRAGGT